ncbi:MAG: hypothetical protein AAF098_14170, partial [Pseudomonadota bacterium]
EFLRDHCNSEVLFVTSDTSGKLLLALRRFKAFTVNELVLAYSEFQEPDASSFPSEMGELDLKVDWLWTPPNAVSHPEGLSRSSVEYKDWKLAEFRRSYSGLLSDLKPDVVMTWNGTLAVTGCLVEIAERNNIDAFYMERGLLPDTLVLDRQGVNYRSSLAGPNRATTETSEPTRTIEASRRVRLHDFCDELKTSARSVVNKGQSLSEVELRSELGLSSERQTILLPLQIESDTNIVEYSPAVKEMLPLVSAVVDAAARLSMQVIVKPHPEDARRRASIEDACDHPCCYCSWDHSLHSLLAVTDVAIVINSTVGLEALMQDIPVIALGNSIYSDKGFTEDIRDLEQIESTLKRGVKNPFTQDAFWLFLDSLLSTGLFSYDSSDPWGNRERLLGYIEKVRPQAKERCDSPLYASELFNEAKELTEVLSSTRQVQTVIVGGFETEEQDLPAHVITIGSPRQVLHWLIGFRRTELAVGLQLSASLFKRLLCALIMPKKIIRLD